MDTFKRELYMRARTLLEEGVENCVCWSLMHALRELGDFIYLSEATDSLIVEDTFPEFFSLDDRILWYEDHGVMCRFPRPEGTTTYWWRVENLAPRLRILDCILNSHWMTYSER